MTSQLSQKGGQMNKELGDLSLLLRKARSTTDVFGKLPNDSGEAKRFAQSKFRQLAKIAHPDLYSDGDKGVAQETFKLLSDWWNLAQEEMASGTFGSVVWKPERIVSGRLHQYVIGELLTHRELADDFVCLFNDGVSEKEAIIRVSGGNRNDVGTRKEYRALGELGRRVEAKNLVYFPTLVEGFEFHQNGDRGIIRFAIVLEKIPRMFDLEQIQKEYPGGVDPKDMIWMWRRLLFTLGLAHQAGVYHNAVTPTNVLIQPEQHGLILSNWGYCSIRVSEPQMRVCQQFSSWYPKDITASSRGSAGLDIYLSAKCMLYLTGGDATFEEPLKGFFKGVLLDNPTMRPSDAWKILGELDELIVRLWGPRKFRPFRMP